ncbi:DUF4397 domain-containing protein [Longitalea luteola]|uniref:DUF4397 domain-containing protein n=1 Tax=Longitalea luteola TaxID=2812563 RepID=UPI001A95DAD1|nr:DUF4397 domain-containing protein [Longitalea luteola]
MKKIFYVVFLLGWGSFSCKKSSRTNPPVASLMVVNAIVSGNSVRVGNNAIEIPNNGNSSLAISSNNLGLYVWPLGDSSHPYYNLSKFEISDRDAYSLYLCGYSTAVESILIKESNIPYFTDSVCGIRFMNLSPNSSALNITLSTSPTISEVSNLTYKQSSDFKVYPARATNGSYTFQVRNSVDSSLLMSYILSTPRYSSVTLVIRGLVAASPALGITRINNDR